MASAILVADLTRARRGSDQCQKLLPMVAGEKRDDGNKDGPTTSCNPSLGSPQYSFDVEDICQDKHPFGTRTVGDC